MFQFPTDTAPVSLETIPTKLCFYVVVVVVVVVLHRIYPGEGDVKMNFVEMKGETEFEVVDLRRLSTRSALSPTDHALFTKWAWHWLDENGSWREYGRGPLVRKMTPHSSIKGDEEAHPHQNHH